MVYHRSGQEEPKKYDLWKIEFLILVLMKHICSKYSILKWKHINSPSDSPEIRIAACIDSKNQFCIHVNNVIRH